MLIASRISTHRFERVPSRIPAIRPALLMSWHGEPPAMMSTGGTVCQSMVVMSPRFGTPGKRWARTLRGPGSMSDTHTVSASNTRSIAKSRPPFNSLKTGFQGGAFQTFGITFFRSYARWHVLKTPPPSGDGVSLGVIGSGASSGWLPGDGSRLGRVGGQRLTNKPPMPHQVEHGHILRPSTREARNLPARLVGVGWMLSHPLVACAAQSDQIGHLVRVRDLPSLAVMDLQPQPVGADAAPDTATISEPRRLTDSGGDAAHSSAFIISSKRASI